MPKRFYEKRIAEEQAKMDALTKRATNANAEEFEQLSKDAAYIQRDINNWTTLLEQCE